MTKRVHRKWFAAFAFMSLLVLNACQSFGKEEVFGHSMGGIDQLADNLSVTDFWVNGAAGFQAGSGNASVPAPALPVKWHPGLSVHVVWQVRDWEHDKGSTHEADVPVDPYTDDGGDLWVHFLADGTVRVVVSNAGPRAPSYPGPHDPIPRKRPWDMYPPRGEWRDWNEQVLDDRIIKQRCITDSDPKGCESRAEERLRDDERADARRYLPRCAPMTGENYQACESQALQSMRAARLFRRCHAAPGLPECATQTTGENKSKTSGTETTGAPNQ